MIPIEIRNGWILIHAPKALMVLTQEEFIEALKRGKAWRRCQALDQRQAAKHGGAPHGSDHG